MSGKEAVATTDANPRARGPRTTRPRATGKTTTKGGWEALRAAKNSCSFVLRSHNRSAIGQEQV